MTPIAPKFAICHNSYGDLFTAGQRYPVIRAIFSEDLGLWTVRLKSEAPDAGDLWFSLPGKWFSEVSALEQLAEAAE